MKQNIWIFLVFLFFSAAVSGQNVISGISEPVRNVLDKASVYMDNSAYDSAQFVISGAFSQTNNSLNEMDLYYLLCYEAEIMYYNALFEQGMNSTVRSLDVAKRMRNDTLIGSSENLMGLFMMNLGREREALDHFRTAISKIPVGHKNSSLSFQYHPISNIAECFLKINETDSALWYAPRAIPEATNLKKTRAVAIANWNLAEAWLQKKNATKALDYCRIGIDLMESTPHRDVVQSFCNSMMHSYFMLGKMDSVYYWLDRGLAENQNKLNTDMSRVLFLENATEMCVHLKNIDKGSELLNQWYDLQMSIGEKQQSLRMAILKDYYEKNQRLVVSQELDMAQKKELILRKTIAYILGAMAVVLLILVGILYVSFRQRQRIATLRYNEELQKTSREIELKALENRMAAVYKERNRIASDLHDDIGAALSSIHIYGKAAEKQFASNPDESHHLLARINEGSKGMMERMSDIVWSINPKNDNVESLVFRMKSHASEVLNPLNIRVDYSVDASSEEIQPSLEARRSIYLIFKEAVNNISKYSEAKTVNVRLTATEGNFMLDIEDDGKGFNVVEAQHGNGLGSMSERAKGIGGVFHISSHHGRGTHLQLKVPIANISDRNNTGNAVHL